MKHLNDRILGELIYDFGWCKNERITIWNKNIDVKLQVSAYDYEEVNENQREAYLWIKKNSTMFLINTEKILDNYIDIMKSEIQCYLNSKVDVSNKINIIKPTTIVLLEDGIIGFICKCEWAQDQDIVVYVDHERKISLQPASVLY